MSQRRWTHLLIAAALTLSATAASVACAGGESTPATPTKSALSPASPQATKAADNGGAVSDKVSITLKDNVFDPKEIAIPAGKSVEITLKNAGAAVHNMHVLSEKQEGKDFSSAATINPGEESKFTIKLSKPGTYDFQCDYHLPDMAGKITVK